MNSDLVVVLHQVSSSTSPVMAASALEGRRMSFGELEICFEDGPNEGSGSSAAYDYSSFDDTFDSSNEETEEDSDEEDFFEDEEEDLDWEDDDFVDPGGGGKSGNGKNGIVLVKSIAYILNLEHDDGDEDEDDLDKDGILFSEDQIDDLKSKAKETISTETDVVKDTKDISPNDSEDSTSAPLPDDIDSLDDLFGGLFFDNLIRPRSASPEPVTSAAATTTSDLTAFPASKPNSFSLDILLSPSDSTDQPLTSKEINQLERMRQLEAEESAQCLGAISDANRKWNGFYIEAITLIPDLEASNLKRKIISFNINEPQDVRLVERLPLELLLPDRPLVEDPFPIEGYVPEELVFDLDF